MTCSEPSDFPAFPRRFTSVRGREPVQLIENIAQLRGIGRAFGEFAQSLLTEGRLSERSRELVILWVAWSLQCDYIWGGHILIAEEVGLKFPPTGEGWDEEHALALAAASRLLCGDLDDGTRRRAMERWGRLGLLELAMVVGQYTLVSMAVHALALDREPGTPEIPRRWPGPVGGGGS